VSRGVQGGSYTPTEGSIPFLVLEYLATHPTERLSLDQLESKFSLARKQSHSILGRAVQAGYLVRATDDDEEICYELGQAQPPIAITPNPARHPSLKSATGNPPHDALWAGAQVGLKRKPPASSERFDYSSIDIDTLQIETGKPIPSARSMGKVDWQPLLHKLKVGQSVTLPLKTRSTVAGAVKIWKERGKGEFALRKLNADQLGLWRVS
jgi:hypothetical protein